ncbi:MAG: AAA family ATPase, partial [Candidatus Omnitrophica bacterium]|nr:AAA family ATPase [Candidatus Omnitrophota bacterium]
MLTRLFIRNLKMFGEAEVELGSPVVFIGPNNSGKTTALQALALWKIGLDQWQAKRGGKASPEKRPGVTINRRDLTSIPVPSANLLWRRTEVRRGLRGIGENKTQNIRIEIKVEGISTDRAWACGLEFDFSNEESFVCRPARLPGFEDKKVQEAKFSEIPDEALRVQLAYLPPMSGLTTSEPKWELGRIRVLIGEGQTAQVIRNLCFHVHEAMPSNWERICGHMDSLFRVRLLPPKYIAERGEITMEYKDASGSTLDLASAGRGLLQTLLLLSHLHANPGSVLLLDEPDAH